MNIEYDEDSGTETLEMPIMVAGEDTPSTMIINRIVVEADDVPANMVYAYIDSIVPISESDITDRSRKPEGDSFTFYPLLEKYDTETGRLLGYHKNQPVTIPLVEGLYIVTTGEKR